MRQQEIILERLKKGVAARIDKKQFDMLRFSTYDDFATGSYFIKAVVSMFSDKIAEKTKDVKIERITSIWQMIKNKYFPEWFKKIFPVKIETEHRIISFQQYAQFPDLNYSENMGKVIRYETISEFGPIREGAEGDETNKA